MNRGRGSCRGPRDFHSPREGTGRSTRRFPFPDGQVMFDKDGSAQRGRGTPYQPSKNRAQKWLPGAKSADGETVFREGKSGHEPKSQHTLGDVSKQPCSGASDSSPVYQFTSKEQHMINESYNCTIPRKGAVETSHNVLLEEVSLSQELGETKLADSGHGDGPCPGKGPNDAAQKRDTMQYYCQAVLEPFDICPAKVGTPFNLKRSLLDINREKRNATRLSMEGRGGHILRSGMVLLKRHLSLSDQTKVVTVCRELGIGSAGFYQPGYRDGARLHLKMMCLGKNWDPETKNYGDHRPIDGAMPPKIPEVLYSLVGKAIKDAHDLIVKDVKAHSAEDILPSMAPDICLINFYSESGRLGLHQDRDESRESLQKGLPVVSFSIGDSADFLFGDQRDVDKAEKVTLESGDVLIFGGKSRHIFHGVSNIIPKTAPKVLLEETRLRPGRLNLTFRKY